MEIFRNLMGAKHVQKNNCLQKVRLGQFNDLRHNLFSSDSIKNINKNLKGVFLFAKENGIINHYNIDAIQLEPNDFVPGSLETRKIWNKKNAPIFGYNL